MQKADRLKTERMFCEIEGEMRMRLFEISKCKTTKEKILVILDCMNPIQLEKVYIAVKRILLH